MAWSKYTICKCCDYFRESLFDHAKTFRQPCPECGECNWECEVVAIEVAADSARWWKPSTWFKTKLLRKGKA